MSHSFCPMHSEKSSEDPSQHVSLYSPKKRKKLGKALSTDPVPRDFYYRAFEWLALLMEARRATKDGEAAYDNPNIPAGYTYFGQLVAHDLTLTKRPLAAGPIGKKEQNKNGRSPILDLDTLYGGGPLVSPQLYERGDSAGSNASRTKFKIGWTKDATGAFAAPYDLPRNSAVNAPRKNSEGQKVKNTPIETVMCDTRNEDNLILSQLTVLFYRVHNKFVGAIDDGDHHPQEAFEAARWLTTHAYRRVVVKDYLRRILDKDIYRTYSKKKLDEFRLFSAASGNPAKFAQGLPVEFTMGAMRAGHVMVREIYKFTNPDPRHQTADLHKLLSFKPAYHLGPKATAFFKSGAPMPLEDVWAMKDWNMFFPSAKGVKHQSSKKLVAAVAKHLTRGRKAFPPLDTPAEAFKYKGALIFRDFVRGLDNMVPDGLSLARDLKVKTISSADIKRELLDQFAPQVQSAATPEVLEDILKFASETPPLLFFVLAEAELWGEAKGEKFGPLGSTILAEVMFAAALLGAQSNGPKPELVRALPKDLKRQLTGFKTMADLIAWVDGDAYRAAPKNKATVPTT